MSPSCRAANSLGYSWDYLEYRLRFPLGPNPSGGYRWGDLHEFNAWGGYTWTPGLTITFRVSGSTQGPIRGFDPEIRGPAVPANPAFYGGQRVNSSAARRSAASLSAMKTRHSPWRRACPSIRISMVHRL
ncbi:hypothetical protein [Methylocystis sp.]|uniref:hypothetical protein n=1 Tax=Methylocystis sp. TaxID=1911079 RepID=UPI003DA68074